jgi:hypothetical protein
MSPDEAEAYEVTEFEGPAVNTTRFERNYPEAEDETEFEDPQY